MAGRIGIADIQPLVAGGSYPARAVVGERIRIQATVFREGHDAVAANVVWQGPEDSVAAPDDAAPSAGRGAATAGPASADTAGSAASGGTAAPVPASADSSGRPLNRMTSFVAGLDLWEAWVVPDRMGTWTFTVEAWSDPLETWKHSAEVKAHAGQTAQEMANDFETGALLLEQIAARPGHRFADAIGDAVTALRDETRTVAERIGPALAPELWQVLSADPVRELVTSDGPHEIWVDRPLGEFAAWYEFFPRSQGAEVAENGKPLRHGTFRDAIESLPRVARMGFDILYMPPIHPIGRLNCKGPNNTVHSEPDDVGSPWAIGSDEGGHDAIHPELGTLADFDAFVAAANDLGLEVALDLALQCAPDHPWVKAHPEWFTTRPDGSIAYAENPPKKYQDIYPLNFDNDPDGLYAEVLRVVEFWIGHGVTVFRVDNPHTKPVDFWEWLIAEVHKKTPEAVFLAEAFTRPAMMHELAKAGFTQSYTYFTWRVQKDEITDYGVELVEASDYMRPSFWVNTPDINPFHLQSGNPAMFALRAVLASMLSPTWGVYAGYELYEHLPIAPGREEYLDSEKFQLRPRDFEAALSRGESLETLLSTLNRIRKSHPALHRLKGLWFHGIDNDNMIVFSKRDEASDDTVIVACALNPDSIHIGTTDLWLPALGLEWGEQFDVFDEITGSAFRWGQYNPVILNPDSAVAHVLTVKRR